MAISLPEWWVTIAVDGDPRRTQDHRLSARNEYAAGWLWRQLNPNTTVLGIRSTCKTPCHEPKPSDSSS